MKTHILTIFLIVSAYTIAQDTLVRPSRRIQLELAGFYYNLSAHQALHGAFGIAVPSASDHLYSEYSIVFNRYSSIPWYSNNYLVLSYGKHYKLETSHFYASFGLNVGVYGASSSSYEGIWNEIGPAARPRIELGLNSSGFKVCAGIFYSVGMSLWQVEEYTRETVHFIPSGSFNLYLKMILHRVS